ncbi:MAG TPA: type II secretion system protein GspN [Syntrophales bacterium]|nr:type II secretion system protein GspN [Syntrophales bacterium]HQJ30438.1 type II secretion system protein GspN [Syntrophales bacterium]
MKFKLKLSKAFLGYMLAAAAILVVMLYLRFPGEMIAGYLISSVASKYPDAVLNIDAVSPVLPPGMKIQNITLGFRDRPQATLHADYVYLTPDYMEIFQGKTQALLNAAAYGGTVAGNLLVTDQTFSKGVLQGELRFNNLNMEKIGYLRERMNRQITGRLKGTLTFSGSLGDPAAATGRMTILLTNGVYPLITPFMGIDKLEYSRIDGDLTLQNGTLKIGKMKLAGEKFRADLSGSMVLNGADMENSQMDLLATIEIPGQQGKKLALVISGSLGNPVARIRP